VQWLSAENNNRYKLLADKDLVFRNTVIDCVPDCTWDERRTVCTISDETRQCLELELPNYATYAKCSSKESMEHNLHAPATPQQRQHRSSEDFHSLIMSAATAGKQVK
jgi:hypothetical protein